MSAKVPNPGIVGSSAIRGLPVVADRCVVSSVKLGPKLLPLGFVLLKPAVTIFPVVTGGLGDDLMKAHGGFISAALGGGHLLFQPKSIDVM